MNKIKVFLLVLGLQFVHSSFSFAKTAQAVDFYSIANAFAQNPWVSHDKTPLVLKAGIYQGVCEHENGQQSHEALYVGDFTNVAGENAFLALSTLQFYDSTQPAFVQKLAHFNNKENLKFVADFIKKGKTGTDNNLGNLVTGIDFQYLYKSVVTENQITLQISQYRECVANNQFCAPPVLQGCERSSNYYQNCIRRNDITTVMRDSSGKLIAKRTADGWGNPVNNLTPYKKPIETYCQFQE